MDFNKEKEAMNEKKITQSNLNRFFDNLNSSTDNQNLNIKSLQKSLDRISKKEETEAEEDNQNKLNEISYESFVEELGEEWISLKNNIGFVNKKKSMILGKLDSFDKILSERKISNSFLLKGLGFNREKFLELVESRNSEIIVFFHNEYYNFLHLGEACRILKENISVLQNSKKILLCRNSFYFVIISPLD
ncbi:MAG TPA: hypothetical protein ENH75_01885 [archaeon]|nr:hypothetical protein [archaeon]